MVGELDLAAGRAVQAALECALELGARTIMVDLARLAFIDAYGIGLIVSARRSAIERGARVCLSGAKGQVGELFALVGLEDLMEAGSDVGDAEEDLDGHR